MESKSEFKKFHLMHTILGSTLNSQNKNLLISIVLHYNEAYGVAWPSVERLCQARGITHEKNFAGVQKYLPGLVSVTKRGRRGNAYVPNFSAIQALPQHVVQIKHTPFPTFDEVASHPASADTVPAPSVATPSPADSFPSSAGANTRRDTNEDNSREETRSSRVKKRLEDTRNPSLDSCTSAAKGPPPAATAQVSVSMPLPLAPELPAPGDIGEEQGSLSTESETAEGAQETEVGREALTEAHRAARSRVLLIEREVERRVRSDEQRPKVLTRALTLDAAGFSGRLDALIDEAYWDGEPW